MKKLSEEKKVLSYFYLILLILWLVFDFLKFNWSDDPFQKVILAPVSEESFKIMFSFIPSLFLGYYFSKILPKIGKKPGVKFDFNNIAILSLITFAAITGIVFGMGEGPVNNILLHFSTSTLAGIFIFLIYRKIRYKDWNIPHKVTVLLSSMILPILFHSVSNQYANICVANKEHSFGYLVIIGRFLQENTFLVNQRIFVLSLFFFVYIILFFLIFVYLVLPYVKRKFNKEKNV